MRRPGRNQSSELKDALLAQRPIYHRVIVLSSVVGLLSLVPTIYMLQIYDRVINSRNVTTLQMLLLLVIGIYVITGILHWARAEIMRQAEEHLDARLSGRLFDAVFAAQLRKLNINAQQIFSDLRTLCEFLTSQALFALIEAPISLLFLVIIFSINPTLGWFAVLGAFAQLAIAFFSERQVQPSAKQASKNQIKAQVYATNGMRNAQVIRSMGMLTGIHERWLKMQRDALRMHAIASDHASHLSALSKSLQLVLGSALLGLGCWLTIQGNFAGGGGMMIVASILGGMVLRPLVQAVSNWKQIVSVREAYRRLDRLLTQIPPRPDRMSLPLPKGQISVESITAGAPSGVDAPPPPILRNVSFALNAGECLAVVGPSGSGKSTLTKLLTGVWPAQRGKVRLDGADVFAWNKSELGPHVGYLPQEVDLFEGTLAENIARFGKVDPNQVREAGEIAGLDRLIAELPMGYDTPIGEDGAMLSGGQRQQVGLARAIYGNPRLVVLDEPNSSLDQQAEAALLSLLGHLKKRGATVILVAHRSNILSAVDRILVLVDGTVQAFGGRDEVLAQMNKPRAVGRQPRPGLGPAAKNALASGNAS